MTEKLKRILIETVKTNARGYILICAIFAAGVVLSCFLNISVGSEAEIKLYINDFVSNVKKYSTDSFETFSIAMSGNVKLSVVLFLLSLSVIGSLGIPALVFMKGFSYGAVFVSLHNMMGAKSILFFACSILPHILISAPCFCAYSLHCIKNAYSVSKGARELKSVIVSPLVFGILSVLFLNISALIQAYFEPILIRIAM